jgi:hypothetical protein
MIWKEVAVVHFKALSWYLSGGTRETHEIPQDSWFPAEIRTRHLPPAVQKRYYLSQLFLC